MWQKYKLKELKIGDKFVTEDMWRLGQFDIDYQLIKIDDYGSCKIPTLPKGKFFCLIGKDAEYLATTHFISFDVNMNTYTWKDDSFIVGVDFPGWKKTSKCVDCNGSGKYQGLLIIENCKTCNGRG